MMNRGTIGSTRHQPVERVYFPDDMTFTNTADRRIAAHHAEVVTPEGDQPSARTASRSRSCRFAAGVTPAKDKHVEHDRAL